MIDESQLIRRISELPDDDLLRIVYADPSSYRFEVRVYAKAEMEKRGVVVDNADIDRAISASCAKSAPPFLLKILARLTSRIATFIIGFAGGLFLFVLANYRTVEYPVFIDGDGHAGWPFRFYTFGGWAGMSIIDWPYLLLDMMIAIVIGICTGFAFYGIISFLKSSLVE